MMKKIQEEEQEILQTKIISPQEMVRDIRLWDESIKSEMRSLLDFEASDEGRKVGGA